VALGGTVTAFPPASPFGLPGCQAPLIAFQEVAYADAAGARASLEDVSLAIPAGGATAIVGLPGGGAQTLFALLQRRCEPTSGRVLLGGRDLQAIEPNVLGAAIAAVERDGPVHAGTLRDNLRGASSGASGGELAAVVAETRLEGLLERLPDGLDSEIAARGARLSGDERQRIAIARALLRRPRVLLLDEATAPLDARSEHALRATVARAATRCTVLVIARRRSTVVTADQIVVLDEGRVRAAGTHAELSASDALYRALVTTDLIAEAAG
jgi:ATP-binding cassette subfamily B protein/ATP-binding cassette subfamily C protein